MGDATLYTDQPEVGFTAVDVIASGEIRKMADGQAGVYMGLRPAAVGDRVNFRVAGQFRITCASASVIAAGARVFWDASADTAILAQDAGYDAENDFFVGTAVVAKASGVLTVLVSLNTVVSVD